VECNLVSGGNTRSRAEKRLAAQRQGPRRKYGFAGAGVRTGKRCGPSAVNGQGPRSGNHRGDGQRGVGIGGESASSAAQGDAAVAASDGLVIRRAQATAIEGEL